MTSPKVNLVWLTPKAEHTIEYCARASSPKNQEKMKNGDLSPGRLLRYCADHGHWSVLEMASACFEIQTTRSIARQLLRHRSFSFQEFSTRYASVSGHAVCPEIRRAGDRKQGSHEEPDPKLTVQFEAPIKVHLNAGRKLYDDMIRFGVANEVAREILPECTPTKLYMCGTLRSWVHFLQVRTTQATQKEARAVAGAVKAILAQQLPIMKEAFWPDNETASTS